MGRSIRALVPLALVAVALSPATPARATFSGANGLIVFATFAYGCSDIYTIHADGTGKTDLTKCPEGAADPSWNAAGNRIAFATSRGGAPAPEIYTMDPTGSRLFRVTNDSVEDTDPSWNDDGSTIVEGRTQSGPFTEDVATVPAAGGMPSVIEDGSAGAEAQEPEFSPDGTKIAFQKKNGFVNDIFVMDANGLNEVNITPGDDGNSEYPSWSPDQSKIAFASDRSGDWQIWVMDADGNNLHQITTEPGVDHIQPTWSPDQKTIAFTKGCDNDACGGGSGDIDLVDVTDLTAPGTPAPLVATAAEEFSPDWGVPCSADCGPVKVGRSASLRLRGHLAAGGALVDRTGTHPQCAEGRKVKVQRNDGTSWRTAKTVTTDATGHFLAKGLANLSGRYRAVAPRAVLSSGTVICLPTASKARRYAVMHGRVFVRFATGRDVDHGGMSYLFEIRSLDAFDDCVIHVPVQVQRRSGSSWVTVATATTSASWPPHQGGNLIEHQPAHAGTYRAFAPRLTQHGGDHDGDVCVPATSKASTFP